MFRRLPLPLLLTLFAALVATVPALRGDAQETGAPEIEELPLGEEVPLGDEPAPAEEAEPAASGWQADVVDANLVAVTWTGDPGAEFIVEVQVAGGEWQVAGEIGHHDNGPDPGTPEGDAAAQQPARNVSEALWTDDVAAVRLSLADGAAHEVTLITIDSPRVADPAPDRVQANAVAGGLAAAGAAGVVVAFAARRRRLLALAVLVAIVVAGCVPPKQSPPGAAIPDSIIARSAWGADLPWNTGGHQCGASSPTIANGISRAVVHHTVNSNSYAPEQSAQIVRGIWALHAQVNGWCDIGYNFLIDRFGRVFEGRRGGIDKAVVGAHAAGANTGSTGIAFVGDHRSTPVPGASQGSIINLIGWKFRVHFVDPVPGAIIGHLQVNQTECPGAQAVALLPMFRDAVRAQVPWNRSPVGNFESVTAIAGEEDQEARVQGWALDPDTPSSIRVRITVQGAAVPGSPFLANVNRSDIRQLYPYHGNHGFNIVVPADPGQQVCVTALNHAAGGSNVLLGCRNV